MVLSEKQKNLFMILPAIVYIVALSFYPSIVAVIESFKTPRSSFTLFNYQEISIFNLHSAIVNTVVVTGLALLFQFVLGFIIATILTKEFAGRKVFSVLFLIPFGVATVVAGFVFFNVFTYSGGYANSFLNIFGIAPISWENSYATSVLGLVISDSWKNTPIVALILFAGMSSISPDVYHASTIDGAGPFSRFFRITLPNLSSYIAIALIIRGVSEFNIFAMALLLFPYKLLTTLTYAFYSGTTSDYLAYASATILLSFILVFTGIVMLMRNRSSRRDTA